jgi:integrase
VEAAFRTSCWWRLVFPTPAGLPWTDLDYRNWRRPHFNRAARESGLDAVRPYDLRHSFASLLLAEQTNPAEIAAQLGHSHQVLFSTYAHVIEELRGSGRVSAEEEIRGARQAAKHNGVAQKLPTPPRPGKVELSHGAEHRN